MKQKYVYILFGIIIIFSVVNILFLGIIIEKNETTVQLSNSFVIATPSPRFHGIRPTHNNATISTTTDEHFDAIIYEKLRKEALKPFPNLTTVAYPHGPFGGFRNQYMTFTGIILMMNAENHKQLIVESIKWKDLFGTNQRPRHDLFFDIVHWNKFYPTLPRFVSYDANIHTDVQFLGKVDTTPSLRWNVPDPFQATNPFAIGERGLQAQNQYKQYVKKVVEGLEERDQADLAMLQSAFRPHPALQEIIDSFIKSEGGKESKYMVLHARIEPDMQKHNMCPDKKTTNLTDIIQSLEKMFPDAPPVSTVLIILNREIIEKEVADEKIENDLAEYNLKVLNHIVENGLWNGKVKAIEAGVNLAKKSGHPVYSKYFSLSGSIIDFFLAVQADIFVGTEVSSFSVDVEITRFYRGRKENYHYLPNNFELTTPPDAKFPPRFKC